MITRALRDEFDLLALHHAQPGRYPFLLQSVAHGTERARYDILFAFPGDKLELDPDYELRATSLALSGNDFLQNLDHWWRSLKAPAGIETGLPFYGGWFVYLGYELAAQIEPGLRLITDAGALPVACAVRVPAAVVRDHARARTLLVAEADQAPLLDAMEQDAAAARPFSPAERILRQALEEDAPQRFLDGVQRVLNYIRAGDVFQVNLSRAWRGELRAGVDAAQIYARLCRQNPAPFAGLACFGEQAIISSSPELLVKAQGDRVETRPIAGTRPRRRNSSVSDVTESAALLAHPKERAEHIMLIDLERNDLGRVCVPGSVEVNELMTVESYAHVHHIVSGVRGKLRAGVTPAEVLRAVFPGGTITGCPKVRCMEIIAELEQCARGPYTGGMGYLNRDGGMQMNILIRTLVKRGRAISLRAGSGIVADSVPERELEETRAKARGLLMALDTALDRAP
ncbi:MAG: aminodeoxychorismate synthase component I [Gammaproteobacteria bacterium]